MVRLDVGPVAQYGCVDAHCTLRVRSENRIEREAKRGDAGDARDDAGDAGGRETERSHQHHTQTRARAWKRSPNIITSASPNPSHPQPQTASLASCGAKLATSRPYLFRTISLMALTRKYPFIQGEAACFIYLFGSLPTSQIPYARP